MNDKIVITTDGRTTTAVQYDGKKRVAVAIAVCSPDDEFDFLTGAKIALDRLPKTEDYEWVVVDRPAKVGDYIRLTGNGITYSFGRAGDILPVRGISPDVKRSFVRVLGSDFPCGKVDDNHEWLYVKGEYEVVERRPKAEKPKLYNGKMICVDLNGVNENLYTVGKVYGVTDGFFVTNLGTPNSHRIESFSEWQEYSSSKWLEVVE